MFSSAVPSGARDAQRLAWCLSRTAAYGGTANLVASDGASTYSYDPSGGLVGVGAAAAGGGTTAGSGSLAYVDLHSDVVGRFAVAATVLAGSAAFDPLGNVLAATGQSGRLGYQSGWTDPSTGVVDMAARWYNRRSVSSRTGTPSPTIRCRTRRRRTRSPTSTTTR